MPTLANRPCGTLKATPAMAPLATTTTKVRSFLSSRASMLIAPIAADVTLSDDAGRLHDAGNCAALFHERRELRALIRHEHRDQFRRLGVAGVGGNQMDGAGRLEEGLSDFEGLDDTARQLRADFALGDIGGDGAGMPVRAGEAAGTIEHPHDGHAFARHV